MSDAIIEISDLVKTYDDTNAVDHLSLNITKGEIFGLLGPNGAGKTTIILTLLGLTEPTHGSVIVKGFNATSEPISVKKITGYLPDEVGFSGNSTGLESLIYTAMLNGIPREDAIVSAKDLLKRVGLEDAGHQKTKTYSKGMTQRLGLADVLIKEPEIMILDEPTIGIDPKGINDFLDMVRNLSKEKDITVLLCSHLLHQVQQICDRVGILVDGQLLSHGNIKDLANELFGEEQTVITAEVSTVTDEILKTLSNKLETTNVQHNENTITVKGSKELAPLISETIIQHGSKLHQLSYEEHGLNEIYQHYFKGGSINV